MDLNDPVEVALGISEILVAADIEHALYGALLLAAYGEARETKDADLAALSIEVEPVLSALRSAKIDAQVEFCDLRLGGLRASRIALFWTPADPGMNNLDLLLPMSERFAAAAMARSVATELRARSIRVLTQTARVRCQPRFSGLTVSVTGSQEWDSARTQIFARQTREAPVPVRA